MTTISRTSDHYDDADQPNWMDPSMIRDETDEDGYAGSGLVFGLLAVTPFWLILYLAS